MKTLFLFLLCIIVSPCSVFSEVSVPDMIDKAIKGVVIVEVPEIEKNDFPAPFGVASTDTPEAAYKWTMEGKGASGFVVKWDNRVFILTNTHLLQYLDPNSGKPIYVYSHEGKKYETKVVGGDDFYDIGVLEFVGAPGDEIKAFNFRDDDESLRVGEQVFAIGHPLLNEGNHQFTVTIGIVSGKNRKMGSLTARFGLIQHTAFLLYGNSGGPLIDANGDVIGINTLIQRSNALVATEQAYEGSTVNVPINIPTFYINFSTESMIIKKCYI